MSTRSSAGDARWYRDAVFYQLHVRSYADSNGDGVGDFPGLVSRLDHLQWLGVDCLWLLPFYPSPLRDDGYDVADYRDVHPDCGTLADFRRFLDAAHAHGLRVIADLVVNHTSDQHPWFRGLVDLEPLQVREPGKLPPTPISVSRRRLEPSAGDRVSCKFGVSAIVVTGT